MVHRSPLPALKEMFGGSSRDDLSVTLGHNAAGQPFACIKQQMGSKKPDVYHQITNVTGVNTGDLYLVFSQRAGDSLSATEPQEFTGLPMLVGDLGIRIYRADQTFNQAPQ
jgi:hypothetical protein